MTRDFRDGLMFCLLVAIVFFSAVQHAELNKRREQLRSDKTEAIYLLTKANKEIDFTIKRFQQLQKLIPLREYCETYNYRGWVSYDGKSHFPCQMLNPKNKIGAFELLEMVSDVDRAGLTSNKLQ